MNPFVLLEKLFPSDDDLARGCGCGIMLLALASVFGAGVLAIFMVIFR